MASDDPSLDLARTLQTLVWTLRRFGEQQVGLSPLPPSEYEVIHTVSERPGSTVSEVARQLSRQVSNISTSVRHLVERGLVVRETDPNDRRSTRLYLTEQAQRDRAAMDAAWHTAIGDALAGMTDADAATLEAAVPLLRRLAELPRTR